jgi:hypothetical protein
MVSSQELAYLIILGMLFTLLLSICIVLLVKKNQRIQELSEKLMKETEEKKELEKLDVAITTQEKERSEIARLLHDDVGARLSFVLRHLSNVEDRAELGETDLNEVSLTKGYVEDILSGENDLYLFDNTTDSVYRDVIEGLNPKNMKHLREYVIENLKGQKIETETIELEDIDREQGHPEYVTVDNPITAQTIIYDKDSMNYLLDTYLEDLKSEIESIHTNAYNHS